MSDAALPEIPALSPARFEADFACGGCGYNLRGLSMDGKCPECGHEIRLDLPAGAGITFHIVTPGAIGKLVRRALLFSAIVGLVVMAVIFGVQFYRFPSSYRGHRNPSLLVLPLVMILSMSFSVWFTRRHLRRQLAGYLLMVSDGELLRWLPPHPPLRIPRATVTRIENTRHGLTVRTADSQRFIVVPAGLEGFPEVAQRLGAWRPSVRGRHAAWVVALRLAAMVVFSAAFFTLLTSSRKPLVLAMGVFVVGWVVWSVWKLFKHPQLSTRTKWVLFAMQLLILIWVVYRCWWVLER